MTKQSTSLERMAPRRCAQQTAPGRCVPMHREERNRGRLQGEISGMTARRDVQVAADAAHRGTDSSYNSGRFGGISGKKTARFGIAMDENRCASGDLPCIGAPRLVWHWSVGRTPRVLVSRSLPKPFRKQLVSCYALYCEEYEPHLVVSGTRRGPQFLQRKPGCDAAAIPETR